jgi:hypothetical protein
MTMKNALRLVALVGVMFLVSWIGSPKPAYALPYCDNLAGGPCSPEGKMIECISGHCWCTYGLWECI